MSGTIGHSANLLEVIGHRIAGKSVSACNAEQNYLPVERNGWFLYLGLYFANILMALPEMRRGHS